MKNIKEVKSVKEFNEEIRRINLKEYDGFKLGDIYNIELKEKMEIRYDRMDGYVCEGFRPLSSYKKDNGTYEFYRYYYCGDLYITAQLVDKSEYNGPELEFPPKLGMDTFDYYDADDYDGDDDFYGRTAAYEDGDEDRLLKITKIEFTPQEYEGYEYDLTNTDVGELDEYDHAKIRFLGKWWGTHPDDCYYESEEWTDINGYDKYDYLQVLEDLLKDEG